MGLELALVNRGITLLAQLAYVYAFRGPFERQAAALRARFRLCLLLGFCVCAVWLAVGYGAFFVAASHRSATVLITLTVPLYLAVAAGGAVSLAALSSRLFGWSLEEHPFRCILVGQVFGVIAGAVPKAGPLLVGLYGCSGIGAIGLAEASARPGDEDALRRAYAGLASLLIMTAALAFALWRAKGPLAQDAADLTAPAPPAAAWTSESQK